MSGRSSKEAPPFSPAVLKAATACAAIGTLAFFVSLPIDGKAHPAAWFVVSWLFKGALLLSAILYAGGRIADLARYRAWRRWGRWSYAPAAVCVLVLVYAALLLPFAFRHDFGIKWNQSAQSAGARAELAMKRYYADHKRYTKDLNDLLKIDPSITDDASVTFRFDSADASGYRFSTHHSGGKMIYRFSSKGVTLFKNAKVRTPPPAGD